MIQRELQRLQEVALQRELKQKQREEALKRRMEKEKEI
jgi:hypothetical protein